MEYKNNDCPVIDTKIEKLTSKSDIICRLRKLECDIDNMIAEIEALVPDCCEIDVITDEKELRESNFNSARYMKFVLIYRSGCLQD